MPLSHLQIRNPKEDETGPEAATQIFSSLLSGQHSFLQKLFKEVDNYSFEIYLTGQSVYFYVTVDEHRESLLKSLIQSSYPLSSILKTSDPIDVILKNKYIQTAELKLQKSFKLPLKTFMEFADLDPISTVVGLLSKQETNYRACIQILTTTSSFKWHGVTLNSFNIKVKDPKTGITRDQRAPINTSYMTKKVMYEGGQTSIRLLVSSKDNADNPKLLINNLFAAYGNLSSGEGNKLDLVNLKIKNKSAIKKMKNRSFSFFENQNQILNAQELATLWHPPGKALNGIRNIAWGKTLMGEPPENLPTVDNTPDEEKNNVNFFAKTEFKNKETTFGIHSIDRRKHMYIIGKTGAGKSTLIANMAIDDIRRNRGIGIIDPHGDLSETILEYIPKRRINDVVYLEPFDTSYPFSLNVLEIKNHSHRDLISSGIVSIFYKLYGDSWGPRLEYILRNTILTLLEIPNSTLPDVLPLLSDNNFRNKKLQFIQDPVLKAYWENEFTKMTDRLRVEAISPIQNKIGQFVSSKMIRNIIDKPKSTIDLEDIMNSGKILILNLSQGKLGEDNASLLGAMLITQMQLAAMNRSFMKEVDRRDFFMYVDEFQNFATSSFIKILSEARKYRLALTLANQYIEQIDEDVMTAIFGNIGTLASFVVGARDANFLTKEFSELYTQNDLVSLGKYETVIKMSINEMTSSPFPAKTLPLPSVKNENSEKIIRLSKEKYGRAKR